MVDAGETQDLVRQLRKGDGAGWERLSSILRSYIAHLPSVLRPLDDEEVLCDTLSTVWQGLAKLRQDGQFLAFTLGVARRIAYSAARNRRRFESLRSESELAQDANSRHPEAKELSDLLLSSVAGTSKELFSLLYLVGADQRTVRERLGVTGGKLRKLKHHMHKKLRSVVRQYERGVKSPDSRRRRETRR